MIDDEDLSEDLEIKGFNKDVLHKGILGSRGYKVNKWLIYGSFVPSLIILFVVMMQYGSGSHYFVSCPMSGMSCNNPFYSGCNSLFQSCADSKIRSRVCSEDPGLCEMSLLPAGFSAGTKPGWLYEWADLLIWIFPLMGAGLNHVQYNKNFKWRSK